VNNIICGNSATNGGGICCSRAFIDSFVWVTNNTIFGNTATNAGGGIYCWGTRATITNSILYGNQALSGKELWVGDTDNPSEVEIDFCDLEGSSGSIHVEFGSSLSIGAGMIDVNPLFVGAAVDDYHLRLDSFCVDAGNNSAPGLGSGDYEGDTRIVDGNWPQDGDAVVDIGADELLPEIAARFGNVNAVGNGLDNVLKVNESKGDNKRIFSIPTGNQIMLIMDAPTGGPNPSDFSVYVIPYESDQDDLSEQPSQIGIACIPMPLSNGNVIPPPFTLCNTIGYNFALGNPILTGIDPAPCTIFDVPGLPIGTYTFQGYIFDNSSAGPGLSLTNAIVLKVE